MINIITDNKPLSNNRPGVILKNSVIGLSNELNTIDSEITEINNKLLKIQKQNNKSMWLHRSHRKNKNKRR